MNFSDVELYLPKFLSTKSLENLYIGLKDFPANIDGRLYTNYLKNEKVIFQGDCLKRIPIVDIESLARKDIDVIVLSNTCDIAPENKRYLQNNIIIAPLIKLNTYINILEKNNIGKDKIRDHLNAIKAQKITQIFYLPQLSDIIEDSIVFFDKIYNVPDKFVNRELLNEQRIITLSDYGAYLFLFKISMHFTRIHDMVERKSI